MPIAVTIILGSILAIAATVLVCIFLLPKNKKEKLTGFWKCVSDYFNFNDILVDKIFKVLFVFETLACIIIGFLMIFSWESFSILGWSTGVYYGGYGLLIMIFGPIVNRVIYELVILFVKLVKNIVELNEKTTPQKGSVYERKLIKKEEENKRREEEKKKRLEQQQLYMQQQMYMQQQQQQMYNQNNYQNPVQQNIQNTSEVNQNTEEN